jgi:2-keto-4-pentenoate hydratase/2-oxohepta-3-ene-1,7-dioic acid hydratase in catechol pathway
MKIARFLINGKKYWGCVEGDYMRLIEGNPFRGIQLGKRKVPLEDVKLLAPVKPNKIILVGLNYKDHAEELGMKIPDEPIIFLKPNTSVIGPEEKILYPPFIKRLDYEAELAIVIRRKCKDIKEEEAKNYIFGYTCLNDVTARDLQRKDIQWTRSKSFDTFCPIGPWIETDLDPSNLKIRSYLNGELKQDSSTSNFIFSVPYIVSFVSKVMTLQPGDIISTGTPPGVGEMKPGDVIEIEIEGIGKLRNYVWRA